MIAYAKFNESYGRNNFGTFCGVNGFWEVISAVRWFISYVMIGLVVKFYGDLYSKSSVYN
jgi:hypothetical protein